MGPSNEAILVYNLHIDIVVPHFLIPRSFFPLNSSCKILLIPDYTEFVGRKD